MQPTKPEDQLEEPTTPITGEQPIEMPAGATMPTTDEFGEQLPHAPLSESGDTLPRETQEGENLLADDPEATLADDLDDPTDVTPGDRYML